jgi:hypothetical protein
LNIPIVPCGVNQKVTVTSEVTVTLVLSLPRSIFHPVRGQILLDISVILLLFLPPLTIPD